MQYNPEKTEQNTKCLINIGIIQDKYWVYAPANVSLNIQEQIWIVLRYYLNSSGESEYTLRVNDVIKIGKCKFTIKELVFNTETRKGKELMENTRIEADVLSPKQSNSFELNTIAVQGKTSELDKKEAKDQCRICLGEDNLQNNPLISSPCACTGSIRHIHLECLKEWLKSQITEKKTDCTSTYIWEPFKCDVCKTKYPDTFTMENGQKHEIMQFPKPQPNYMILEANTQNSNEEQKSNIITYNINSCSYCVIR